MNPLTTWKSRLAKYIPAIAAALVLGSVGGFAVKHYAADCCYPGAACCHPGAACCASHNHAAK